KKEQLVPEDSSASGGAELITPERRVGRAWPAVDIVEEIFGIESVVAQKVVRGAVERIGAALGDGIDLRGAAPVFRRVGIGLDLELLNLIDGWNRHHRVEIRRRIG